MNFSENTTVVYSVNFAVDDLIVRALRPNKVEVYKILDIDVNFKTQRHIYILLNITTDEKFKITQTMLNASYIKIDDALWYWEFFNRDCCRWVKTVQRYTKNQVLELFCYGVKHEPIWQLGFKLP